MAEKRYDYVGELYRVHCDHDAQQVERAARKVLRKLVKRAVIRAGETYNSEWRDGPDAIADRIARELVPSGKRGAK